MSDTPRTDAVTDSQMNLVPAEFAEGLERELNSAKAQIVALRGPMEALTAACEEDFGGPLMIEFGDDESVGGGPDGEMPITFGMIRDCRKALSSPAPDVVPLAEAEALADQLDSVQPYIKDTLFIKQKVKNLVSAFRAKHPKSK